MFKIDYFALESSRSEIDVAPIVPIVGCTLPVCLHLIVNLMLLVLRWKSQSSPIKYFKISLLSLSGTFLSILRLRTYIVFIELDCPSFISKLFTHCNFIVTMNNKDYSNHSSTFIVSTAMSRDIFYVLQIQVNSLNALQFLHNMCGCNYYSTLNMT